MKLNTYIVEGGVGKCTAFTALISKLKQKADIQIYTPYVGCFAGNPNVKMAFEQTLPLQDPRIMASNNIFYSKLYADLYTELIHKYEIMNTIFEANLSKFFWDT